VRLAAHLTPSGRREPVRRADSTGDFHWASRAVRREVHGLRVDHGTTGIHPWQGATVLQGYKPGGYGLR